MFNMVEPLDFDGRTLVLGAPNSFVKDRIEGRYRFLLDEALANVGPPDLTIAVWLTGRPDDDGPASESNGTTAKAYPPETSPPGAYSPETYPRETYPPENFPPENFPPETFPRDVAGARSTDATGRFDRLDDIAGPGRRGAERNAAGHVERADPGATNGSGRFAGWPTSEPVVASGLEGVNQRYTFDAFVTGASNRFAHAAALSVAETPGRSYNPLFIYGDAGLGKTHLLQAIAHYVHVNYPGHKVRYVSTETFMNEFVDAIRTNATMDFKRRYREIDVLLVDDIQFMEGKEGLQEEFFHTFNYLYQLSHQIVLSSDRPPDAISTLEDRLRSRFKMGLITDIQPPELETRLAILRKKAEQMTGTIPDEVMGFIASNITNNIRELEGALIRVAAFASLNGESLTMALAEQVLADTLRDNRPRIITPQVILEATCTRYGFTIEDLCGKSRRRPLVAARQVAMYVMREMTDLSYPNIAKEFGGRDHTTVIHAVEKIATLMKERRQIYDQVTELIGVIKSGGPR
jgi:chromosomal replication initiator protein